MRPMYLISMKKETALLGIILIRLFFLNAGQTGWLVPYIDEVNIKIDGNIEGNEYPFQMTHESTGIRVYLAHDGEKLYVGLAYHGIGWVSIKFGQMGSYKNEIIATVQGSTNVVIEDRVITMHGSKRDVVQNIIQAAGKQNPGYTYIEFNYPLASGDEEDLNMVPGETYNFELAYQSSSDDFDTPATASGSGLMTLEEVKTTVFNLKLPDFDMVFPSPTDYGMNDDLYTAANKYCTKSANPNQIRAGGPLINPGGFWETNGAIFNQNRKGVYVSLTFQGKTFTPRFGHEDYAVILIRRTTGGVTINVGGITRYGTRAGLLYLVYHYTDWGRVKLGKILLRWQDTNGNGKVDINEISVVTKS